MMQHVAKQLFVPATRLTSTTYHLFKPKPATFTLLPSLQSRNTNTVSHFNPNVWYGTTILCVRKNGKVCMIGDGQVSMGNMKIKPNARKIRRLHPKSIGGYRRGDDPMVGETLVGFAGTTADAFTLLERLEGKMDEYPGQLMKSCVELAKGWRTDKYMRALEASLIVSDKHVSLQITGNGDVLESHDKVLGIGSGSSFAMAAARALQDFNELSAEDVAIKAIGIAADMCVYTNNCFVKEIIDIEEDKNEDEERKVKGKTVDDHKSENGESKTNENKYGDGERKED